MNPEIKQRWIAALRSGSYKQTTKALHDNLGFCCLGVLCDITKDQVGGHWDEPTADQVAKFVTPTALFGNIGSVAGVLPLCVSELCGFGEKNKGEPSIPIPQRDDPAQTKLSTLNDSGFTFSQIADIINYAL